jgi:hypothetical protein
MTVWSDRDLPVLLALTQPPDPQVREGYLSIGHGRGSEALGVDLDDAVIYDAMLTLGDAGYIDFDVQLETGPGAHFTHLAVTGGGMQALGQWPLFDAATSPETIALMLEHLAPEAPTEEESTNLRRAADYIRGMAPATFRSLAASAISALIRAHLGLP